MSQVHEPLGSIWGPPSAFVKKKSKKKRGLSLNFSYIEDPAIWECIKPAMESLASETAFYFDSRGDLTLKVGDSSDQKLCVYEFVVCSRSLARWSSVFRAMLFTGFAESRPKDDAPWTIEMPEDSVSPVFLLLSIVHGHFQHIPKSLPQDHLYQLLVVTEKYDMTQTLSPWASAWFQPYAATNKSSSDGEEIVMWISWELGHEGTFCNSAKNLLLKSKINDEGELLDSNSIALSTYTFLEPPGILETIAATRATVIHEMTRVLYDAIEVALKNDKGVQAVFAEITLQILFHRAIGESRWKPRWPKRFLRKAQAILALGLLPMRFIRPTDGMWEFLKQKAVLPTAEIFSEYEGDLTLVVGPPPQPDIQPGQDTLSAPTKHENRRFRVNSKTMATVSDVFDCMLFGGFAESKPAAEPWVVSLPDDDPWAMFFIVATAHGYSSYIPEYLGTDELRIVLHLVDKYAVKPILAGWLQKWISECPDHQSLSQDAAWLIGHEKIFTDHVKASCENARIDVRGDLTNQSSLALCYYASLEGFDQEG
ncbi:hypothetical protein K4K48_009130 [Colletotrichum sp. SAR 10_66]|nr:hypothetical protein K4K48_009130 [Colletotrichum sp. SAR 10_66]